MNHRTDNITKIYLQISRLQKSGASHIKTKTNNVSHLSVPFNFPTLPVNLSPRPKVLLQQSSFKIDYKTAQFLNGQDDFLKIGILILVTVTEMGRQRFKS